MPRLITLPKRCRPLVPSRTFDARLQSQAAARGQHEHDRPVRLLLVETSEVFCGFLCLLMQELFHTCLRCSRFYPPFSLFVSFSSLSKTINMHLVAAAAQIRCILTSLSVYRRPANLRKSLLERSAQMFFLCVFCFRSTSVIFCLTYASAAAHRYEGSETLGVTCSCYFLIALTASSVESRIGRRGLVGYFETLQ